MELRRCSSISSAAILCANEDQQSRSQSSNSEDTRFSARTAVTDDVAPSTSGELSTKVYYHIGAEVIPYCAILDVSPQHATLGDFKRVFNRLNFKYYCKVPSPDSEISSEVKVEIQNDDERLLRSARGQFELYLESYEESSLFDESPDFTLEPVQSLLQGLSSGCSKRVNRRSVLRSNQTVTSTETDSYASTSFNPIPHMKKGFDRKRSHSKHQKYRASYRGLVCKDSAIGSGSEVRFNSDDEEGVSTSTDITSVSRQKSNNYRKRCNRKKFRQPSQSSFYTSILENSMSMDVLTVTLDLDTVNYLGISIVGQSSLKGDNGIYVANVIKGGAVALDGRIAPGDMIIQVNDIALDNFTNDQAVDVLKGLVARKGYIKLTVAKMWDGRPRSNLSVPRRDDEPVRPIDLNAWIQHTNAMRGLNTATVASTSYTNSSGLVSSSCISPFDSAISDGFQKVKVRFSSKLDKVNIARAMALPDSGLELKDRFWLKMLIPNSFLGADLVDWLLEHVEGINDRKQARDFASELLAEKLITHFVDMFHFTEKCYYTFGETLEVESRNYFRDVEQYNVINSPFVVSPVDSLPVNSHPGGNRQQKCQAPYAVSPVFNKYL